MVENRFAGSQQVRLRQDFPPSWCARPRSPKVDLVRELAASGATADVARCSLLISRVALAAAALTRRTVKNALPSNRSCQQLFAAQLLPTTRATAVPFSLPTPHRTVCSARRVNGTPLRAAPCLPRGGAFTSLVSWSAA